MFHLFTLPHLSDADKIEYYEEVIRDIHYYHNEPSKLSNRTLTLSCTSQNGRFISNKFVVRVKYSWPFFNIMAQRSTNMYLYVCTEKHVF